ncbi:MAG: benzoate-CoA ligase family protein [Pseudonocardia sp.]|nr:benzoate-CoA ligase family protein [Pseudonocardia sp.]
MTETFNAATYLVHRHVAAGDGARTAIHYPGGTLTYAELAGEVVRVARGLTGLGVHPEERVLLCMTDDVELLTGILACFHLGAVAVPASTMLTGAELAKLVVDSRARIVLGSAEFAGAVEVAVGESSDVRHVVLTGDVPPADIADGIGTCTWEKLLAATSDTGFEQPWASWPESPALWLYTSGTTGTPKAAMHRHADIRTVCETYGDEVLGIGPDDVVLSVAKLFFAYGIGNSLFFPLSVGAGTVLEPGRPTPMRYAELAQRYGVTLLFAVPSFWGPLLASDPADVPDDAFATVRRAASAGEALPARMYHGILERFGVEILDGIGSTEALHIFISNRAGAVVPGSSGFPVPGYRVEVRRPDGTVIEGDGEPGMLYVAGDSICTGYWCRTEVNRTMFEGEWMRTGDQYVRNADGSLSCLGRSDDVLKVGGIWVPPAEVEARLLDHPDLEEAVVVGIPDADGLDKPVAFVVPRPGRVVDPDQVVAFCREGLAAFKRPRQVVVVESLPKTATGKIQRFRLRQVLVTSEVSARVGG